MRSTLVACLALAVALCQPGSAPAQPRPTRVKIDAVRFGLPADNWENAPQFRAGAWMPVYIDMTAGPQGLEKDQAWVIVESNDNDEIANSFAVPLPPAIQPNEAFTVIAYTRPGNAYGAITVSVRSEGKDLCPPVKKDAKAMDPGEYLYLTVGSRVDVLRVLLQRPNDQLERDNIVKITDVRLLPEHWFGYAAVDLLILTTGANRDFFTALVDDKNPAMERKRRALVEWVQRGGQLVISLGRNHDVLTAWTELQQVLPVAIRGTLPLPEVLPQGPMVNGFKSKAPLRRKPLKNEPDKAPPIEVVRLEAKPGQHLTTLLSTGVKDQTVPLVVQAAQALGQVTVVAFDLDQEPFLNWDTRIDFWRELVSSAGGANLRKAKEPDKPAEAVAPWMEQQRPEILGSIQDRMEDYGDEVPVISFGWVALFIVLYILVVGPLDYLFLKKVVKRLELTWITFPTVVLTVSAVAYFAAYYIKGNELKINKVDVIDIDLQGQQTYGTTWFTLFSPRIQHYTIGVEPVAPEWVAELGTDRLAYPVVVSWMGRPDSGRSRGQGLFRRSYEYETNYDLSDARLRGVPTGLKSVPIQVWSTKSFTASWQAGGSRPLFTARLHHAGGDRARVAGEITSQLPIELEDAVLIHAEDLRGQAVDEDTPIRVFELGTLTPNTTKRIAPDELVRTDQWFGAKKVNGGPVMVRGRRSYQVQTGEAMSSLVKTALFFDSSGRRAEFGNQSLRYLDQSWRVRHNRNGVIVYGRLTPPVGPAEDMTQAPVSPSRLWLGALPGRGSSRPHLSGTLRQETYVRVFIPIK